MLEVSKVISAYIARTLVYTDVPIVADFTPPKTLKFPLEFASDRAT